MGESPGQAVCLKTGDPADAPASYTRFVLPFIWSLERPDGGLDRSSARYRKCPVPPSVERRSYFTPETADALFSRARWFELSEPAGSAVLDIGGKAITANIAPPRVVLFEAAGARHSQPILSTGFLLLDMSFPTGEPITFDDLLVVNELWRYWRRPFEKHPSSKRTTPEGRTVSYTAFAGAESGSPYFGRWAEFLSFPVETENGLRQLVTSAAAEEARLWTGSGDGKSGWIAATDERAFVWTCALTERGAGGTPDGADWIRLLNVDFPATEPPTDFEKQWVQPRTYERWKHRGTLYGFNAHAGAMLGKPCEEPPTWRHFSDLYFDQVLLLLYLRVSTFRFSRELSRISEHLLKAAGHERGFKEFRRLRRSFAFLTNLYRFPLISSQQQGIEMYACARKALDVDELFEEVQKEIESTHEFFEMATAARLAHTTTILTYVAAYAAVVGVLLGTDAKRPLIAYLKHLPCLEPEWILILMAGVGIAAFGLVLRLLRSVSMR